MDHSHAAIGNGIRPALPTIATMSKSDPLLGNLEPAHAEPTDRDPTTPLTTGLVYGALLAVGVGWSVAEKPTGFMDTTDRAGSETLVCVSPTGLRKMGAY